MSSSPTARTLAHLRRRGYCADVVERFIAGAGERGQGIHRDLFHCIDLVAVKRGYPVLGVQATSVDNVAARLAKAKAIPELRIWLAVAEFQVWGWALRRERWAPKIIAVTGADLVDVILEAPPRKLRKSRFQPAPLFGDPE